MEGPRAAGQSGANHSSTFSAQLEVVQASIRRQADVAKSLASHLAELQRDTARLSISLDNGCHTTTTIKAHVGQTTTVEKPPDIPGTVDPTLDDNTVSPALDVITKWKSMTTEKHKEPRNKWKSIADDNKFAHDAPVPDLDERMKRAATQRMESNFVLPQPPKRQGRVFADAEELKEQIRQNLVVPQIDVSVFFKEHGFCQAIVRSNRFETLSMAVVSFSALWITVDVDWNSAEMLNDAHPIFQVVAHMLCTFFVAELIIRLSAFKKMSRAFQEMWIQFDCVLVALMVFDTWVLSIIMAATGASAGGSLRILVIFRIMRLLRVLRLARVIRELPELLVIVRGVVHAGRAIMVVLTLLGFIIYVSAIIFRVLLDGTDVGKEKFDNVAQAMATLLIDCTISGARGGNIMKAVSQEHVLYGVLVFLFVLLSNITMLGVLTGLLVQTVKTVAECEKEENAVKRMADEMEDLWSLITAHDDNNDGLISEQELKDLLQDEHTARVLLSMGIDLEGMVNVSNFIFEQNAGQLTKPEFKRMVLDLRGRNHATVKDHVETRKFIEDRLSNQFQNCMDDIKDLMPASTQSPSATSQSLQNPVPQRHQMPKSTQSRQNQVCFPEA